MKRTVFLWALVALVWGTVAYVTYLWNIKQIRDHGLEMAVMRGQLVYELIQTSRKWNTQHGGVYVPATDDSPPNPYLKVQDRDITTPSGVALTLVNPAYMTRQLGDLLALGKVNIHLTSLNPLNPANRADAWEAEALRAFESGETQRVTIADGGAHGVFRFMAPLIVEEPCLTCHQVQGYRVGDVRGGLSVSFPGDYIVEFVSERQSTVVGLHILAFMALTGLTWLSLGFFRSRVVGLEREKQAREQIIEQRTRDLENEISARRKSEIILAEREETIRSILDNAGEGIYEIDPNGVCLMINPAAVRMLGYDEPEDLIGKPIHQMVHHKHPDGEPMPLVQCALHQVTRSGKAVTLSDESLIRRDGTALPVECYSYPVLQDGHVVAAVVSFFDVSRQKHLEAELRSMAIHDYLTQIFNRRYFMERVADEIERTQRYDVSLSLLLFDLDHFKKINDTYGHAAGDAALVTFVDAIKPQLRASDTFGRVGGEEFGVLLPNTSMDKAMVLAERLRDLVSMLHVTSGEDTFGFTVSIGVTCVAGRKNMSMHDLVNEADEALYLAKKAGRDRVELFGEVGRILRN
ncbi:diguanylate cyclase [Magnetospira sp. QH-2]|uniref:diguanylate cyclase n=1 Tax=Magnetospira sp. (strain QH-2) TaxID=1288970 RepID=UPI0003E8125A|nr:diguanylate cyclase [Magnetospira sp. QH-2]CCQ74400.1 putative Diguanylate cyclase with PAS/PAC sensor [Magnetospira sp. QH-2]